MLAIINRFTKLPFGRELQLNLQGGAGSQRSNILLHRGHLGGPNLERSHPLAKGSYRCMLAVHLLSSTSLGLPFLAAWAGPSCWYFQCQLAKIPESVWWWIAVCSILQSAIITERAQFFATRRKTLISLSLDPKEKKKGERKAWWN